VCVHVHVHVHAVLQRPHTPASSPLRVWVPECEWWGIRGGSYLTLAPCWRFFCCCVMRNSSKVTILGDAWQGKKWREPQSGNSTSKAARIVHPLQQHADESKALQHVLPPINLVGLTLSGKSTATGTRPRTPRTTSTRKSLVDLDG